MDVCTTLQKADSKAIVATKGTHARGDLQKSLVLGSGLPEACETIQSWP